MKFKEIPFTIELKDKILNKSEKYVQVLYTKYFKTPMKDFKRNLNKWRYIPHLWNGMQNYIKMSNWTINFMQSQSKS